MVCYNVHVCQSVLQYTKLASHVQIDNAHKVVDAKVAYTNVGQSQKLYTHNKTWSLDDCWYYLKFQKNNNIYNYESYGLLK